MTVANDNADDIIGIEPDVFHLVGEVPPAAGGVPVINVLELLPAAVVQCDFAIPTFDDTDIGRKVEKGNVVLGISAARDKGPVGHEAARSLIDEPAALDQPCRVKRSVACFLLIAQQFAGALETLG